MRHILLTALLLLLPSLLIASPVEAPGTLQAIPLESSNAPSAPPRSPSAVYRALESDDQLLLDEYRLADKVEARVFGNLKVYGAILGLAVAFIGFLGFQVLVDVLTRRLEKAAKDDLEAIRTRTQATLVELELAVREGRRISGVAAEQIETVRKRHAELEELTSKYRQLHTQVQEIGKKAEAASIVAAASQEKATSLGVALTNTFAGSPAIFETRFNWPRSGEIGGKNFGSLPGRLQITFLSQFVSAPGARPIEDRLEPISVSRESITEWGDTGIKFSMPEDAIKSIKDFQAQQEGNWSLLDPEQKGDRSFSYEIVVERADGETGKM